MDDAIGSWKSATGMNIALYALIGASREAYEESPYR